MGCLNFKRHLKATGPKTGEMISIMILPDARQQKVLTRTMGRNNEKFKVCVKHSRKTVACAQSHVEAVSVVHVCDFWSSMTLPDAG